MTQTENSNKPVYTCNEYRQEMTLLALRRHLQRPDLSDEERTRLIQEIAGLEKDIGF